MHNSHNMYSICRSNSNVYSRYVASKTTGDESRRKTTRCKCSLVAMHAKRRVCEFIIYFKAQDAVVIFKLVAALRHFNNVRSAAASHSHCGCQNNKRSILLLPTADRLADRPPERFMIIIIIIIISATTTKYSYTQLCYC